MELRSGEASQGGQPAAEGEAHERTPHDPAADDDTATGDDTAPGRPAFTPASREADDDAEPGAMPAPTPTVFEPAGYTRTAAASEPVQAPPAAGDDDHAGNWAGDEADEAAHETAAYPETLAPAPAEPVTVAPPAAAAPAAASEPAAPIALAGLDQPLLRGDTGLLAQWQLVQVGFIDDPRAAVAGAADLIEQAGRELIDALRQRQQQMRATWDHGPAKPGDSKPDTEQLRQVMQGYQALFKQLSQS